MRRLLPLALLSATAPFAFGGGDCGWPGLCGTLNPGMVAFIGTQVTPAGRTGTPTVVFKIQKRLVGLANAESATVVFEDGYHDSCEPQLLIVTPTGDGRYRDGGCGAGIHLRLDDPLAKEFQRNVAARAPAKLSVVVRSWPGWAYIPGVRVQMRDGGRVYEGYSSVHSALDFGNVPPGEYEVTASRPNFTLRDDPHRLTVLPGSCAPIRILMKSATNISGRVVDAQGRPVVRSRFLIYRPARTLPGSSLYDWFLDRMRGTVLHRSMDLMIEDAVTGNDGSFNFDGVYPGWYRLLSDTVDINQREGLPFPRTYYGGARDWRQATVLPVDEGQSIKNVLFRLPDFGTKKRVEIRVVDDDGVPVPGAAIQDDGTDCDKIGAQKISGKDGRVTLDLWPTAEYNLHAELWLPEYRSHSSGSFRIPSGAAPVSQVVVLKDYHSRKPAR